MTCRIAGEGGPLLLEFLSPWRRRRPCFESAFAPENILGLATSAPVGLSARNIIPGFIKSLEQDDVIVSAKVKGRVEMETHLTMAARDSLQLEPGQEVWLVIEPTRAI